MDTGKHVSQALEAKPHPTDSIQGGEKDIEKGAGVGAGCEGISRAPSTSVSEAIGGEQQQQEQGSLQEHDQNVVWWDGDSDPENPLNWSEKKKWTNLALLSCVTFITPLASSMFAPGVPQVLREFHTTNNLVATFVVSVYVLGFAMGPLIIAPLSEMYGRAPLYHAGNVGFIIFTIACAVSNSLGMLIAFRFLAGCFGAACLTIGAGTIADVMPVEKRGAAMAIYAMGPLLGPVIGPVCGGFLVEAKGWRWVFWLLTIVSGAITITCFLFLRETYAPVLLSRKAARLRKETSNPALRSKLDTGVPHKELLLRSVVRPTKMLFLSPLVGLMSLYVAVVYGILYLLFTTFTFVFEGQYGFSSGTVGLTYIGIGIGMILGLALVGKLSDATLRRVKAGGGEMKPEHRLPFVLTGPPAACIPAGLFIYGWTVEYHEHWAIALFGTMLIGFGLLACMMCVQTYLVDAYTKYAASAMAANAVLRSVFGALLPLAGLDLYKALGLGWGNSLLAFLALALIPVPILFKIFGERIRNSKYGQVKF
ncbi:putative mfs multidrug protein [Neofusicoccum parvum]|uniref:Mfs multidrug protein n=1 Tax=Neofusicoccum parvum TaxID=310453 RepID=A0ACB5RX31_9PEZI|nr:putative mfs multidrug protein [Neofusicoccum parvum]